MAEFGAEPPARQSLPSDIEEDSLYRALFLAYPDALLLVDQEGTIVLANPAAARLLRYTLRELTGLNVDALVPVSIRPRHAAYREAYGQVPRSRPMGMQMELVALRKDGSEVMVEIALSPLRNQALPIVVVAIRDISDYPRVKQALLRARYSENVAQLSRLAVDTRDVQTLLDHVPDIVTNALQVDVATVWLLDECLLEFMAASSGGTTAVDQPGSRMLNHAATPAGFVLSQGRPVIVQDYSTEDRFVVPAAYRDAGLISGLAAPLSDRGRVIGVLSAASFETRRFNDEEIRFLESLSNLLATSLQRMQTEEALNHAQRLESVGQLTEGIAHDFNNLLTVIQGNLQVLEDLPVVLRDVHASHLLAAATRATRRGAELTGKLLAFSRRQVLQPSTVDISALLHSLADMLRRTLDQRIHIEVDVPDNGTAVQADAGQLESALLNISINARDAMPAGGTLRFAAEQASPPWPISGMDDADRQFVAIAVSDSGVGMTEAVKKRAFEPFFTTKEAGRGTGLGLSTVYGFIKQSHGGVVIDSVPGVGTTVTLYLPSVASFAPNTREDRQDECALPSGIRVILVEDDPDVRKVAHALLSSMGCSVSQAASAESALSLMALECSAFDLLFSDIALGPGMRGTQLAAEARRRFPLIAVLLTSGGSAELLDSDRIAARDWEFLSKPYTRSELIQAVALAFAARA